MKKISRRSFLRAAGLAAVIAGAAGAMAGCGSSSSTAAQPQSGAASQGAAAQPVDKIVDGITTDPNTFEPFVSNNTARLIIFPEIYEPLAARDCMGGDFNGVIAKSWEWVDDRTVDITIYENVHDSQGNAITASDVVFSWKTAKESGNFSKISPVESFTALDDYTIEFVWSTDLCKDDFESIISEVYIVSEKAYNDSGDAMATHPVGTGAYVLDSYTAGSNAVIKANADYWQEESLRKNATQWANVPTIEYQIITESSQLAIALETGTIDITENCSADALAEFQDGGQMADQYDVYVYMDNRLRTLYPNCDESSACHNEELRKAIFYAIDTTALAMGCFGDLAVPAHTFGASCYGDFIPSWENEPYFDFDLDEAKQHLDASGYDVSKPLVLMAQNNAEYSSMAQMVQVFLQQLGLQVDLKVLETAQFNDQVKDPTSWDIIITHNASYNLIISAWKSALDNRNFTWGGTRNFIFDDNLQELVLAANAVDATEADMEAVHEYLKEHAYIYGLLNTENGVVYNSSKISGIYLGKTRNLIVGACTLA